MRPADHRAQMSRLLEGLTGAYRLWNVFEAWAECASIALQNATTPRFHPEHARREERYERLISDDPRRREIYPQVLAHLVEALTLEPHDALGTLLTEHGFAAEELGQYFTPYEASRLTAHLTLGSKEHVAARIEERSFITLQEPSVGAGGMVIAVAELMREWGFNPQTQLWVTAIDVETTAAHLAHIQLSLLGIPAQVILGNTLTLEVRSTLVTPAHTLGLWEYRLRATSQSEPLTAPSVPPAPVQPALFEVTP